MLYILVFFFFKQKTEDEMRISDWSSDVCSSDLVHIVPGPFEQLAHQARSSIDRLPDAFECTFARWAIGRAQSDVGMGPQTRQGRLHLVRRASQKALLTATQPLDPRKQVVDLLR